MAPKTESRRECNRYLPIFLAWRYLKAPSFWRRISVDVLNRGAALILASEAGFHLDRRARDVRARDGLICKLLFSK